MQRRIGVLAGVAAAGFVLLARVAAADPVRMWHDPTTRITGRGPEIKMLPSGEQLQPTQEMFPPMAIHEKHVAHSPLSLADLMLFAAVILLIVGVLVWRRLRRDPEGAFDMLPEVPASLADIVPEIRHLLNSGAPRDAIVACWVELERRVARAGLPDDPTDTSSEFTARVLGAYLVDPGSIHRLAALFREARFSSHQLGETHRAAAVTALADLEVQLRRPTSVGAAMSAG